LSVIRNGKQHLVSANGVEAAPEDFIEIVRAIDGLSFEADWIDDATGKTVGIIRKGGGINVETVKARCADLRSTPPPSPGPTPSYQSAAPAESITESQLGWTLALHDGDQRAVYTIVDVVLLKHIATALEEYAIDHDNRYPDTLSDVSGPPYLNGVPIVPGSLTGAHYSYRRAPADQRLGSYVITDADATVDAALVPGYQVPRGVKGTPCAPGECRHLEFSQKLGLIGLP
jgi:hypothetical protein